jgi:hypothetical protein
VIRPRAGHTSRPPSRPMIRKAATG